MLLCALRAVGVDGSHMYRCLLLCLLHARVVFQLLLRLESSEAFKAKMEGFKCALGKLLASWLRGTPGQQESIYCRLELLSSVSQSQP